ncbi:MAG: DinB family protein [Chloroflexota bacterium]
MRDKVVEDLRNAASLIDEAVDGLTEEQASARTMDGWSVKDHLTHLTIWHEMRFFEISRVGRQGSSLTPNFPDIDAFNDVLGSMRRELPLSQVMGDLDFAREMVMRAVADCPEDRLDSQHYLEASPAGGAIHDVEHAEHIRNWRHREGI